MSDQSAYIQTWLEHIRVLSEEIGPRGPTTEGERRGSEYCQKIMEEMEIPPKMEQFASARSIFQPHLLAAIAMLVSFAIYPLGGRTSAILAFLLALLALVSDLLELSFRNNLLRILMSKGQSQNVLATISPQGEHQQDLILIGHVDSQRTPIVFKNERWLSAYKSFTTIAFVAFAIQVILYGLGIIIQASWIWPVSSLCAICAVLLAAMCIQADLTPFTRGANDNASAVGLVLTLAKQLKIDPLKNTCVWLVCTGCEEVQHYGAIDFFARHRSELKNPKALVFEMLGCAGPAWLVKEGIVVPFHAEKSMVALAEKLAKDQPELHAYPASISGGNTEMADALRIGIPAITFTGFGPKGEAPHWHMVGDTFDKMDLEAMKRNYAFTWQYIRLLDAL
jgi:hypothetical protein